MAVNQRINVAYGLSQPLINTPNFPIVSQRAPTVNDFAPIGTLWVDRLTDAAYILVDLANNAAVWNQIDNSGGAGVFTSLTVTDGPINLDTTGTNDIVLNSADTVLIDSVGVLELNSSAGVIGIGNDAVAQNINIGTGAAARTITVGNITGATAVNVNTGTGGYAVNTTGAGDILLNSADTVLIDGGGVVEINSSGAAINIGNDAIGQPINLGTGAAARTITLGNVTSGTTYVANLPADGTGSFRVNGTALVISPVGNPNAGIEIDTSATTGFGMLVTTADRVTEGLIMTGGGILVDPELDGGGASPRVVNARFGQASFTDVINAAAVGSLVVTNSEVQGASVILANVFCATAGSALVINNITPGAGTVTFSVTNLGGTNTGANIFINFWILS